MLVISCWFSADARRGCLLKLCCDDEPNWPSIRRVAGSVMSSWVVVAPRRGWVASLFICGIYPLGPPSRCLVDVAGRGVLGVVILRIALCALRIERHFPAVVWTAWGWHESCFLRWSCHVGRRRCESWLPYGS